MTEIVERVTLAHGAEAEIRLADIHDAPALQGMVADMSGGERHWYYRCRNSCVPTLEWTRDWVAGSQDLLVAVVDGDPVGYFGYEPCEDPRILQRPGWWVELETLVAPPWRRTGVGRALMEASARRALGAGWTHAFVETHSRNFRTNPWLRCLGATQITADTWNAYVLPLADVLAPH